MCNLTPQKITHFSLWQSITTNVPLCVVIIRFVIVYMNSNAIVVLWFMPPNRQSKLWQLSQINKFHEKGSEGSAWLAWGWSELGNRKEEHIILKKVRGKIIIRLCLAQLGLPHMWCRSWPHNFYIVYRGRYAPHDFCLAEVESYPNSRTFTT